MKKESKQLILSSIFMIIYTIFSFIVEMKNNQLITDNMPNNIANIIIYSLSIIGIIYFLMLAFNNKIDLNKHSRGILFYSILFFIINIVSGVIGFMLYSNLDKKSNKKVKRELPVIEYKPYTNKYICLLGFILCMVLLFYVPRFINSFYQSILIYVGILAINLLLFWTQLKHDFKLFKEYFREYFSLVVKTWLKSLLIMMILSILIQIITNTNNSVNQQNLQTMFNSLPIFVAILSMFYAPFAEELLFRGVVRKFVNKKYLYIFISGLLFGLLHVIDDSKSLAEFSYIIVYSVLGFYLASLYYKTNNLFTNISFHFLQNTLGVIGMILLKFLG